MKKKYIQIENKNAILELLEDGRKFLKIFLALNAYKDPKTKQILELAAKKGIPIENTSRRIMNRRSKTSSIESIVGMLEPQNQFSLTGLLDMLHSKNEDPFFLIFDDLKYTQNVGAILRSAFAGFVNGIITPIRKDALFTDEIIRISMGAAERIPYVEMNLFAAIKELKKNAVKIVSLHMDGDVYFQSDLTGPVAFVVGAEDTGVSDKILERSDLSVTIPMKHGIGSMNVSASTAIVVFEKIRQESVKTNASL